MSERLFSMLANGEIFLYDSSMADQITEPAPTYQRKRWRKTKWFYGIVLVYIVVTIVVGSLWSAYSHRKFNEAVDPIIARGEPLAWSDFATDPIPDDQNAAVLYQQAAEIPLVRDHESSHDGRWVALADTRGNELMEMLADFIKKSEVRRECKEDVRELLDMAEDVFALCRKARGRDKADWGVDFNGVALGYTGPPECARYCDIASLLSLAAIVAHESGRDDEAIEYLRDGIAMGNSMITIPSMIAHLMTTAVSTVMNASLEE
ncbi:MAG: hypothetical protein GY794_05485, partial [bacterium]|nr:hypothetical protein [bacterium]